MGSVFNVHSHKASLSQISPRSQSQEEHTRSMEGHHNIQTLTCSLALVNTSLLVVSLGGLLCSRLLERLEGHTEDAHYADSTMKTQAVSICAPVQSALQNDTSHVYFHQGSSCPWHWFLVCLSLHMFSCSEALLLFLSLSHHSSPCRTILLAILPPSPQGEQAALGGGSWLADQLPGDFCQNSELGLVQLSQLLALPIHQPLL